MAAYFFTGWGGGALLAAGHSAVNDASSRLSVVTGGRTATYAFQSLKSPATVAANAQFVALGHNATTPNTEAGNLMRIFIKLLAAPSGDDEICGWVGSSENTVRLIITSSRTFKVSAGGVQSSASTFILPLNEWVEIQLGTFIHNDSSASAADDYVHAFATIGGETVTALRGSISNFSIGAIFVGSVVTNVTSNYLLDDLFVIGDSQAGPGTCSPAGSCGGDRDLSDIPTLLLPDDDEVLVLSPTGEGAANDWTNDWQEVDELPFDTTGGASEQSSSSTNDETLYTHDGGIVGAQGVRALAMVKGSGTQAIHFNGVEYNVTVPGSYVSTTTPNVVVWGALSESALDAAEFGFKNLTGASLQIGAMILEVLGPSNTPPVVDAGPDQLLTNVSTTNLEGSASDDGKIMALVTTWSQISGPEPAVFDDENDPTTLVTFSASGVYVFELEADDGQFQVTDQVAIDIDVSQIDFDPDEIGTIGIPWVEWTDSSDVTHVWSDRALPDPASYFGGFKAHLVTRWGSIRRALSDVRGQYVGSSASWVSADTTRFIRNLLAAQASRVFFNRSMVIRAITDPLRRLLKLPKTVFRGLIRNWEPLPGGLFRFDAEDYLVTTFQIGTEVEQVPKRTVGRTDFTDCPEESLGLPVPVIYGDFTLVKGSPGGQVTGVTVVAGPVPGTAPSAPSVSSGGGGAFSYEGRSYYAVKALFPDPEDGAQFIEGPLSAASAYDHDDGEQVDISWGAVGGAVGYAVFRSSNSKFTVADNIGEVDTGFTSQEDHSAGWNPFSIGTKRLVEDEGVPDWDRELHANYRYQVWAKLGPDTWSYPGEAFIERFPMADNRPKFDNRLTWDAFSGAIGYRIIRWRQFKSGGYNPRRTAYDKQWDVGPGVTMFTDNVRVDHPAVDPIQIPGANIPIVPSFKPLIPTTHVGSEEIGGTTYQRLLVCGHAQGGIEQVFTLITSDTNDPTEEGTLVLSSEQDFEEVKTFGDLWLVPGKTGWPHANDYVDLNGRRYTLIYFKGVEPPPVTRLAMKGITVNPDGTGAVIASLIDQYLHALQNWLIGSSDGTTWLDSPTFPDDASLPQIDETSFATVKAITERRVTGGYVGAVHFGLESRQISLREALARLNISCDVNCGFNLRTQFFISMLTEEVSLLTNGTEVTQLRDIKRDTFSVVPIVAEFFNRIPYTYFWRPADLSWDHSTDLEDATSIAEVGETRAAIPRNLYFVYDQAIAEDIIRRFLLVSKEVPVTVKWSEGLAGLNFSLGDIILLTHSDGIGAQGYVKQPIRVTRQDFNPGTFQVDLEGWDAGIFFADAFILGDTTSLPAAWTSADSLQQRYGYLGSVATGLFSDGARAKRLR